MAQQPCWPPMGPESPQDICISPPSPVDPGCKIVVNSLQHEEVSPPFDILSPSFHGGGGMGSKEEKRLYQKLQEYAESCSSSDNEGFQDAEEKLDDHFCKPPQCNGLDTLKDTVDSESDIVDSVLGDNQSDSTTLELSSNISSVISSPIGEEVYNGPNSSAFTPCETTLMNMEKIISEFENAFLTEHSKVETDNHCPHDSAFEEEPEITPTCSHVNRDDLDSELKENSNEGTKQDEDWSEEKISSEDTTDNATLCLPKENNDLEPKEEDTLKNEGKVLLRSTSLKTGKTPPGTPHRKKIVRFADALGLDLEDVKHIVSDELPNIPSSAFSDLKLKDIDNKKLNFPTFEFRCTQPSWASTAPNDGTVSQRTLYPEFIQPATLSNFMDRVREQKASLENVVITDMTAHCIIRVLNLGFEKTVTLRVTTNEWATYNDVTAGYVSGDSVTDRFAANLLVPHVSPGQRVVFAIRYIVNGVEYWDSNNGANYVMRCQQGTAVAPLSTQSPDPPWIHHFL